MGVVVGGTVRPHALAFAEDVVRIFGKRTIGTYEGHQPTRDRALDIFADRDTGDRIAQFALDNWDHYGLLYVIWEQRINSNDGRGWRLMENRGSVTANHYDHNHDSFKTSGSATPSGPPPFTPTPPTEEDKMFSRYPFAAAPFAISAAHSGLVVACPGFGATEGAPLITEKLDGGKDQRWGRWGHADGTISLVNSDRLAWDIPDGRAVPEVALRAWTFNAAPAQRFEPVWVPDPYVERYRVPNTDLFIDIRYGAGEGAALQLYANNDALNQHFKLSPTI